MSPHPPEATPRNRQEFRQALAAQRRWFMLRLWVAGVGFALAVLFGGLTLHLANQAQNDAEAAVREVGAATLATCERQNELRSTLRGTLARGREVRRAEGTLTPRGEAFYAREIAGLADIDCRAIVPAP